MLFPIVVDGDAFPLLDVAVTEGIEQLFQVGYLAAYLVSFVGVGHAQASLVEFHNLYSADNVCSTEHSIFGTCERLVLHQLEATAMLDQSIAGNTGFLMVG